MRIYIYFLLITLFFLPSFAFAQNTGSVFGPVVNDNHRSMEYRITVNPDNASGGTSIAQRLHYQQSINSELRWRILAQARKTANSDIDFDYLQAELTWQITEDGQKYQTGLRFDGRVRDNNRGEQIGIDWMNQWALGDGWTTRFLVLTDLKIGNNTTDGIHLQTRANLFRKLKGSQKIGVEMFNDYGNTGSIGGYDRQKHMVGPFVSAPLTRGISIWGGALFGVSDAAADTELRMRLTKKFE